MGVEDRLLQPDRAEPEHIAQQHDGEPHQHEDSAHHEAARPIAAFSRSMRVGEGVGEMRRVVMLIY